MEGREERERERERERESVTDERQREREREREKHTHTHTHTHNVAGLLLCNPYIPMSHSIYFMIYLLNYFRNISHLGKLN